MKNLSNLARILLLVCLSTIGLLNSGCKKDKPTKVIITVVDENGNRVQSANVELHGESSTRDSAGNLVVPEGEYRFKDLKGPTDASGQISFDLSDYTKPGQAGFVNLNITATKIDQTGYAIVRVEEQKTNEKTVIIAAGNTP